MNIAGLLQGLATVAWLAAIGVLGFVVFSAARGKKFGGAAMVVIGVVVLAIALTGVAGGMVFIEPSERGVVISALSSQGYRTPALGPGLHWVIPFAERVQRYSIARQTYTMSVAPAEGAVQGDDSIRARTKDGQEVLVDASVIYSIDPDKVVELHITWQDRYENGVVRAVSRGTIRDAASSYTVEEIVSTKRTEMEALITETLSTALTSNNLKLVQFVLRDIHFSEEYAQAVEQKQISQQQAQQAAYVVEQKKQEAQQAREVAQGQADAAVTAAEGAAKARVIQAQAEADALTLINEALKGNPDLLTYRYIEKLAPNIQVMYLPSGQPFLITLPTAPEMATSP
jgi:regulator of protease activity HflC (stomatin/prohibitin superfamily)